MKNFNLNENFTTPNWQKIRRQRKLIGRIVKVISVIVYLFLLSVIGLVLWLSFSSSEVISKETGVYIPNTFISTINDKTATVFENEDGSYSARVELKNGNLKKIIKVSW